MTLLKDPKNLLILLFIALLLSFVFIIVRHHHLGTDYEQEIAAIPTPSAQSNPHHFANYSLL